MTGDASHSEWERFDASIPPTLLPLPSHAHVPGTGTQPDLSPLEAVKAIAPDITENETWADNQAYVYGFALLQNAFYWEAHEVWEAVWLACRPNSRERALLRALIQVANARLKLRMGRQRGAERLVKEVLDELDNLGGAKTLMGVSVPAFRCWIESVNNVSFGE